MTTLVLADVPEPVWNAFQSGSARRHLSAPRDRSTSAVVERWSRAASLGASSEGPDDELGLVRGAALRERDERFEHLARSGQATIERAAVELSARDFVLLVADPEGVVVRTFGGGAFEAEAQRVRLIEGALWNEAARGTNAIGTALVERRPVHVHGRSHFGRRFHGLCCYAAPVRYPGGDIALVLDATSFAHRADEAVGAAVARAARALEDVLRGHAYESAGASVARLLTRTFDRLEHPVLLVEAPGRIVRSNESARTLLEGDRDLYDAGDHLDDLGLSLTYDLLLRDAFAPASPGLRASGPTGTFVVRTDPVETASGTLLGLVVHLERDGSRKSSSPSLAAANFGSAPAKSAPPSVPLKPTTSTGSSALFLDGRLFAEDAAVRDAATFAERMAKSDLPVMLLAETGTGKELFATGIHAKSARARGPFLALNCGGLALDLLASELFGHGPSAFTGADSRGRNGLLQAANGGTLFLDEVAEMSVAMQAALLRVLETGTYFRVGETRPQHTDVRIVCATCRDLAAMVEAGTFRKDLYYRLRGVTIRIPAVRHRTDVIPLAQHLLVRLADAHTMPRKLEPAFAHWLTKQPFPGNVRELRSLLAVALVLAGDRETLTLDDLPPDLAQDEDEGPDGQTGELRVVKWKLAKDTLAEVAGNVSAAARKLGVARSTLYRMLREQRDGS